MNLFSWLKQEQSTRSPAPVKQCSEKSWVAAKLDSAGSRVHLVNGVFSSCIHLLWFNKMCWSLLLRTSLENNDSFWLFNVPDKHDSDFCGNWPHLCKQMSNIWAFESSNWTILCEWVMQNETEAGLKGCEIWLDLPYHYIICAVQYESLLLEYESSKNFY